MNSFKKNLRYTFFITLLLLAIVFFLIIPVIFNIYLEKQDYVQQKNFLDFMKKNLEQRLNNQKLNSEIEEVEFEINALQGLLIKKEVVEDIIESLEKSAKEYDLTSKIKIQENQESVIILNLSLEGDFYGIYNFLRNIEALPYALNIEFIELKRNISLTGASFLSQLFELPIKNSKIKGNIQLKIYTEEILKDSLKENHKDN